MLSRNFDKNLLTPNQGFFIDINDINVTLPDGESIYIKINILNLISFLYSC